MEHIPYSELKKGVFLIASPEIDDGIFFRSVVLICDHSPVGSFGIIINKPLDIETPEEILHIDDLTGVDIPIRAGGPNQPNQVILLHSSMRESENTLSVCDDVYLGGDLESLREIANIPETPSILLFLGYSAWGTGLLEKEFLSSTWFLHPASKEHIFTTPPSKMWQTLLREMGGKYKTLSMIPEDLELN